MFADVNEELEGGIAEIEQIVDMNIKEEADDAAEIPEAGIQEEEEIFDMDIEGAAEDVVEEGVIDEENVQVMAMQFTATLTTSNVNNTCHGAVLLH